MISPAQISQGFTAVGSESRLEVLRALVRAGPEGLCVGEIQQRLGMPASTLSHHLRALSVGGLIEQEKHGRTVINRANFSRIRDLADFLLAECCADDPCRRPAGPSDSQPLPFSEESLHETSSLPHGRGF